MASATGPENLPGTTEYSISTDHVFRQDQDLAEMPRERVNPPDSSVKDPAKRPEPVDRPMDSQVMADPRGTRLSEQGHPAFPKPDRKPRRWIRRVVIGSIIAGVLGLALFYGIPAIRWALDTTSTDDAFVSGHTTYVSPRVEGFVTEVIVEQNDRVLPGTVLVRMDREPYEIALAQSEASLVEARANLEQAKAMVKSQLAAARGAFFRRKNQQEQLRRQIKSLEAQVAALQANQSSQHLAELDQQRLANLVKKGSATQAELDQRNNTLDVAKDRVKESWTDIQETRAALGLGPDFDHPLDVPKDLVDQQSGIQTAVSDISSSLAQIGIPFDAHDIKPGDAFEQIIHLDTSQGLEEAFGRVIMGAPAVKVALATLTRAEKNVANDKLRLSWTEIKSEVAGYIQDRSANPGNRVEPGQTLVSIRPDYVWVDANFKETQLHTVKIGMPVDLYVDAYPKKVFKGRVSGFNPGTGLSESLLPPENATGNYIKVTQRLPVRIELVEPNPPETPLFIGLSVVPYVKIKEAADGPDAGQRLHPDRYRQHPDSGGGPAGKQPRNRAEIDAKESTPPMSTATEAPPSKDGPKIKAPVNHWIVALTVTLATFMEVLDTSIANVALPYIAGGLGVGKSQSTWVLTSYLVANAIVLPLSGWLVSMIGRKKFYMSCVFLFTVASACCGAAPNIETLILCRLLQGLAGGGLQPSEQGILVDTFPKAQLGMAMAIYGVAVVVAPILGPTLGGYITDNYSWRWIFYINIPVGILSLVLTYFIVQDEPGAAEKVKANRANGFGVDYIGLSLATLGLGSMEVIFAKGQEWDWYNDPFWRAQFFMAAAAVGLLAFFVWEYFHPHPIVNVRLLGDRNFLACGVIIYLSFSILYGANELLPQMLQELFGYDAFRAGLVMSPGAFFTMALMPVVGFLIGRKVDSRFIIPFGLVALCVSCYWMAHFTMNASPWALNLPRCLMMAGVGCLFVPLNNSAYNYLPKDQINNATGLFNMLRNEGGSLGIAIASTMVDRRTQFHQSRLAEHVVPTNPMVDRWTQYYAQVRMARGGITQWMADQQGFALMSRMVGRQGRFYAYLDIYVIFSVMALLALPFVFLMRKSAGKSRRRAGVSRFEDPISGTVEVEVTLQSARGFG